MSWALGFRVLDSEFSIYVLGFSRAEGFGAWVLSGPLGMTGEYFPISSPLSILSGV